MTLIVKQTSSYTPPPAGTFIARCYRLIDLGTQGIEYQGEVKHSHRIMIGWELPECLMESGQPFTASRQFTASLHKKSNLTAFLVSWRGRQFTDTELAGFDLRNIVGAGCLLTITHEERQGNTYAKVVSCIAPPKGTTIPPLINPKDILELDHERFDQAIYDRLHDHLKERIRMSPEYQALFMSPSPPTITPKPLDNTDDDDPIPF